MSMTDMVSLIGRKGKLPVEGGDLNVEVEVKDVKKAYGNILYEVTPVNGSGKKWVNAGRVYLVE